MKDFSQYLKFDSSVKGHRGFIVRHLDTDNYKNHTLNSTGKLWQDKGKSTKFNWYSIHFKHGI